VLTEAYAVTIARDWNVKASGAGYVTRFAVWTAFPDAYPVQDAGGIAHQEYWIPAEDLPAFNAAIVGRIEIMAEFGARRVSRNPPLFAPRLNVSFGSVCHRPLRASHSRWPVYGN
jgi:hypothetical protein